MARQGFTSKEHKNMLISQETLLGIKITGRTHFYVGLQNDYVFTSFLQFDPLQIWQGLFS